MLEDEPTDAHGARGARRALRRSSSAGSRTSTSCAGASSSTSTRSELIDLKFRLGTTLEKHLGDAAGALENYREILFLDAQHEGAQAALEALLDARGAHGRGGGDPRDDLRRARRLGRSSSTRSTSSRRAKTTCEKRVALRRKIARISAEALSDYDARVRRARAALKERPAPRTTRASSSRRSRRCRTRRSASSSSTTRSRRTSPTRSSRATTGCGSPRIDEQLGMVDDAADGLHARLSHRPGRRRSARRARAALRRARSAGTISSA